MGSFFGEKFPQKLYRIINECTTNAIKWNADGDTVLVCFPDFEQEYLAKRREYFMCANIDSIVRQLNLYNFRKIKNPEEVKFQQYKHQYFLRDYPELLKMVHRGKLENVQKRNRSSKSNGSVKIENDKHSAVEAREKENIKEISQKNSSIVEAVEKENIKVVSEADLKMDLDQLQSQMKIVIQKHQMVVSEMKNDPQNSILQKQLQDLNAEIMNLSEKQKQIVQQLRNNLQKKPCPITSSSGNQQHLQPTLLSSMSQAQEVRLVCSAQKPLPNHRITTSVQAVALTSKQVPNFVNSLRQPVPPTTTTNNNSLVSSTATLTFKSPMATVMLPNCSGAATLLTSKTVENQKLHPVLVVPSPSNRGADGSQTGVILNIVPPIRVPQYPPPIAPRPNGPMLKCQTLNTTVPVSISFATTACVTSTKMAAPTKEPSSQKIFNPTQTSCSTSNKVCIQVDKPVPIKLSPKKKEFMDALGLVSRDHLQDLKNKKNERKRRTTANPQFSNAALEEKWRNAAALAALAPPLKRPRGRPRLDSKPVANLSNGTQATPESPSSRNSNSPSTSNPDRLSSSCPSTPPVSSPAVNGIHRQPSPTTEDKRVEQLLSNLCIVCTQPGDLVKCDSCAKQQHPGCMQPPLQERPAGQWQCSDCQSRADTLATVHSYDMLKTAKEDEKRKLLKKSLELRLKRSQLEGKLFQLKDMSKKQKDRQSEGELSSTKIKRTLEILQNVVKEVQYC